MQKMRFGLTIAGSLVNVWSVTLASDSFQSPQKSKLYQKHNARKVYRNSQTAASDSSDLDTDVDSRAARFLTEKPNEYYSTDDDVHDEFQLQFDAQRRKSVLIFTVILTFFSFCTHPNLVFEPVFF